MTQALLLKEWLKTRRTLFILFAVTMAFTAYIILNIQHVVTTQCVGSLWSFMLLKDSIFIEKLQYYPMVCGIIMGIMQMIPEMHQRRLKLTLHLPYNQNGMVGLMICYGLLSLMVIFGIQLLIIAAYYSTLLASEMTARVVLTALPWYICGLNAYLFTSAACLESGWRLRVIISMTGIAITSLFFLQDASEAYNSVLWLMGIFVCAASLLSFYSIYRFKEGRQD